VVNFRHALRLTVHGHGTLAACSSCGSHALLTTSLVMLHTLVAFGAVIVRGVVARPLLTGRDGRVPFYGFFSSELVHEEWLNLVSFEVVAELVNHMLLLFELIGRFSLLSTVCTGPFGWRRGEESNKRAFPVACVEVWD